MRKYLPIRSESLRGILTNLRNDYPQDEICKEILRVDRVTEFYLKNKDSVPEICPLFEEDIKKSTTTDVIMLSGRYGEEFEISFLPGDREPEYTSDGKWARRNRQTGKPGRIFQKLLKKEFKQYDWEQFVNRFKSTMCCSTNFEVISGSQITYWYNSEHYYQCAGTLGNSCMKYDECKKFFKLYEDHAKMLISTKNGQLTGRAIVWEMPDGTTLLDRIYTCFDYLENCFIEYAKEHQWWIRANNSLLNNGDDQYWLSPEDDYATEVSPDFEIHIDHSYDYFPYVDSFRYFNGKDTLSTHDKFNIRLSNTDGSYDGECRWVCDHCGAEFWSDYDDETPDGLHYSEWNDEYYCDDCCWWCEYLDDYISNDDASVTAHEDEDTEFEVPESWAEEHNYQFIDGEYYNKSEFKFRVNNITGVTELA